MKLEENIYRLRMSHELSQESLAELLGVSRQSVSKWKTGTSVPDLDKLIKLCDIFGVTLDELTGRAEPSESGGGADTDDMIDSADTGADAKTADSEPPTASAAHSLPHYTYTPAPVRNISLVRRICGTVLIIASLAALLAVPVFLTFKTNANAETARSAPAAIVVAIPAAAGLICGIVCLTVRRHPVLVCFLIVFVIVIVFISLLLATSYVDVDESSGASPEIDAHSERVTLPGE